MFGRKKDSTLTPGSTTKAEDVGSLDAAMDAAAGKGRATPKRREAEAKNRRPLVHNDPKLARSEQRKKNAEARAQMNAAMVSGDDRYLPAQHKGAQRRYIRDFVDARWSLGEFFLPVAFVFVIGTFVVGNRPEFALPLILALYGLVAIAVTDSVLMARRVRKRLRESFGEDKVQRGSIMYAVLRSFQMRPTRMPKPQVKRGQYPG